MPLSLISFSQSIETITEKVCDKICDCIKDDIMLHSEIKSEFNKCYDSIFIQIVNIVDSTEQKLLLQKDAIENVKNGIVPTLNERCEKIKKILLSEVQFSIEQSTQNTCPTNFKGSDLNRLKKLNKKIIAFNGLVTNVRTAHKDKPYYQVELEGGGTIWIASLVKSGYEKDGRILRILGFVSKAGEDEFAKKYNRTKYHILAFCVIDMDSKQMAMIPGAEHQIQQWISGKIPKAEK